LQLRVLGGEPIVAAPTGSRIEISIDLDQAVISAGGASGRQSI